MIRYWTTFATNADPNSPGQPVWSPYSSGTDQFQSLVPPTPVVESTFDTDHKCSAFWNTFLILEDRRTSATLTLRVALVWARIKFKRLRRRFLPRPAHPEGGAPLGFRCVYGPAGTPEFPGQVPDPRSVVGTIVSSIAVESRCPVENANMLRG